MKPYKFVRHGETAYIVIRREDGAHMGMVSNGSAPGVWWAGGRVFGWRDEAAEYLMERAR